MSECSQRINEITKGFKKSQNAFTAIGDETRQLILLTLLESDLKGLRVNDIAKRVSMTRPSVSHHLKILKEARIVSMRPEGTKNYYYLSLDETQWEELADLINNINNAIKLVNHKNSK